MNQREQKQAYSTLLSRVSQILFEADPAGINFDENTDEYDMEAAAILVELKHCRDALQLATSVHKVFVEYFGSDIAGTVDRFGSVADMIWDAYQNAALSKLSESASPK